MESSVMNRVKAFTLIPLGLAIAAMGFYVANADDAPGAAGMGGLLMVAAIVLGVRTARNRLPAWAGRTALAAGVVIAIFAALLTHAVTVAASLFPPPSGVPSVVQPAPPPQFAAAAGRARDVVRAAIIEQNLPGVSVAVGVGLPAAVPGKGSGAIVWAEGFGWRDVATRTPVTPDTRFVIGTAASALAGAATGSIGLTSTGTDPAAAWSPDHIGEPEEDFPLFTLVRHIILQPIGLVPAKPLPDHRATFYVPSTPWRGDTTNPREGRRPMYMRDLGCCAGGRAFYSTPSDLVRFALATETRSIDGTLAGGRVMSLVTRRDSGIAVAVTSNIAYADTAALALKVAEAFASAAQ